MVHETRIMGTKVAPPTIWSPMNRKEVMESWKAPSDEETKRRRSFSVVLYAPKYDSTLREESEISIDENGRYEVHIRKIGKSAKDEYLGTFDTYEEAKSVLFDSFDNHFNRPSKNAISRGWSPNAKVWDSTQAGREVKASISILESDEIRNIRQAQITPIYDKRKRIKEVIIRIPNISMPSEISIRKIYPSYFKHISKLKKLRVQRLRKLRQRKK